MRRSSDKNLIDFSDMEHFALEILLTKDEEGNIVPRGTALELQDYFEEIMVDEYQDTNEAQDLIYQMLSMVRIALWLAMLSKAFIASGLLCRRFLLKKEISMIIMMKITILNIQNYSGQKLPFKRKYMQVCKLYFFRFYERKSRRN